MGVLFPMCARFNVLLLTSAAIGASLVTTFSCQFFTYQALDGEVWDGLEGPFQNLPEASVGLFSFSKSIDSNDALGSACERYNDWFYVGLGDVFQIAQIASLCAPILAFLAWVQILVEFLCCRLYGGLCCMSFLFFLAAGAQACTFLMFANTDFCLEAESENKCKLEMGSYYSFGAMCAYFLLSALVSNTPASPGQRNEGCCIYTGWIVKDSEASPPGEISAPNDPEMARGVGNKDTLVTQDADGNQVVIEEQEIIEDEHGNQVVVEEQEIVEDEDGNHVVVEEQEIVEDADGNQVVVEEEEIVEDADGNQVVVQEEEIVEDADGNQIVVEEELVVDGPDGEQITVEEEEVVEGEGQPEAQSGEGQPEAQSGEGQPEAQSGEEQPEAQSGDAPSDSTLLSDPQAVKDA